MYAPSCPPQAGCTETKHRPDTDDDLHHKAKLRARKAPAALFKKRLAKRVGIPEKEAVRGLLDGLSPAQAAALLASLDASALDMGRVALQGGGGC